MFLDANAFKYLAWREYLNNETQRKKVEYYNSFRYPTLLTKVN